MATEEIAHPSEEPKPVLRCFNLSENCDGELDENWVCQKCGADFGPERALGDKYREEDEAMAAVYSTYPFDAEEDWDEDEDR